MSSRRLSRSACLWSPNGFHRTLGGGGKRESQWIPQTDMSCSLYLSREEQNPSPTFFFQGQSPKTLMLQGLHSQFLPKQGETLYSDTKLFPSAVLVTTHPWGGGAAPPPQPGSLLSAQKHPRLTWFHHSPGIICLLLVFPLPPLQGSATHTIQQWLFCHLYV